MTTPLPEPIRLAVDCMGGDHGPSVTLPACRAFLDKHPGAELILVGKPDELKAAAGWPRCRVVAASEVVTMEDPVEVALRRKRDSSMRIAIQQLKADRDGNPALAHACVSAGNTGALMAVGLLNIGEEAIKGSETIKQAGELLRAAGAAGRLNFFGNVEGNDIYKGTTDIVVCDGFVGNVMLKTSEGLATMIGAFIKEEFGRNLLTKLVGLLALPVLKAFKHRVDHRRFNGAALLGLRGLVFKSHGSADAFAFEQALARAYDAARNRLLDRVHDRIVATLQAKASDAGDNAANSVAQAA
ncbi:MAG: phosphate acyltransferase [Burkholderiales bacterium]|nr:phosphate acyltransferase [Burkholderiales bacterium]